MSDSTAPRRDFLVRLASGAAALGAAPALVALGCAPAAAPPAAAAAPAGDEMDNWVATMKGTYKVLYDCVQPAGAPDGILFARNFMTLSQEKLGTTDADMSVIVSVRHFSTPYGYNDAMWAKYAPLADMLKVQDPKTKKNAARNVALTDDVEGFAGANLTALKARGVAFSVCGAATTFIAGLLAGKTGDAKAIEAELIANLVPGARIVPAGVVAVQRAQKGGFAYTFAG
jgi:intracellular sulfur oxidation DsrE/DsrF family protein